MFMQYMLIVGSRVFTCKHPKTGEKVSMIIPFADMVNHESPHQLDYFIDEYTGGFRFTAAVDIKKN
jgi:hypothetical protein